VHHKTAKRDDRPQRKSFGIALEKWNYVYMYVII